MRISPKLLIFEIIAFLVFAILFAAGYLAWRLSQGPIDLALIRPQVERSLSDARGGAPVKIQSLVLEWVRERGRVEAAARGLTALDKSGQTVFIADRAAIALDAASLLSGKFKTRRLRLENGSASVVRSKDGVWSIADIVLGKEPSADKPFDPLKDLNWSTLATPIRALISAGSFEQVELAGFQIDVKDEKAGTNWSANPVSGTWTADAEGVALDLDMKLDGSAEQPNHIAIALAADGKVSRATGRLTLEGVDPVAIGKMFGYTGDAFSSGIPANAIFTLEATETGGLQSSRVMLSNVAGKLKVAGVDMTVGSLSLDAVYDPATKRISLDSLVVASDRVNGSFSGSLDMVGLLTGAVGKPIPFKLSGRQFDLNVTPVFEKPWSFEAADVDASVTPDFQKLVVSSLKARTGELDAVGSGEIWVEGPPEKRQIGAKINATGTGAATADQVTAFWPVNLGSGGRNWVRDHIPMARATRAVFTMDWPPGANKKGYLPDEHLSLDFTVADATVKFLPDFPPVTNVTGVGHLKGNSLTMDVTGGKLNAWQVDEGKVVLPRFEPSGAMMSVNVMGRGELRDLMRVLDASNLKVGSKYGLVVEQMGGTGGIDVRVDVPMKEIFPDSAVKYNIKGGFLNASAPDIVAGFGLVDSDVRFEVTQDAMSISGAGKFGPAPVVFDWKERFRGDSPGSDLTASAKVTPDLLNAFGVAARNVMQGEADLELTASGTGGREFSAITANVDLTNASIDLSELGWTKKFDAPAKGNFRYGQDGAGALMTGDIRSDGLELTGEARMDKAGEFQSAMIERIFSRDSVDLRGGVTRRPDGGYKLALSGPFFDASPFMDGLLSMTDAQAGKVAVDPHGEPVGQGGPAPGPVFEVLLNTDRLRLREKADITNVKVALEVDGDGPRSGRVTGNIDKDKKVDLAISTVDAKRKLSIKSDDAGFAARVLLKFNYLIGGKLVLDGTFEGARGDANVVLTDVRMKDAPLVAQILSLASLRGLTDVLSGEGVLFTRIDAPLKLSAGRIDLPGLRASGPAMGLTARGWIAPAASELSLDGVLVPSFGVNSLLGGIPIIGDLFVSRQGEGMFSATYSVRGTFSKARVAINPLSAITPGVLRRIFENPTEAPPVAADVPAEKAPAPN